MTATLKILVIGDWRVGKTYLLGKYATGQPSYEPREALENYDREVEVDGESYTLYLRDTPGSRFNPEQRKSLYGGTDVLLVGFRVVLRDTLESIRERFIPEIRESCAGVPIILVGMQTDQREDREDQAFVYSAEGEALANEFGAVKYLECSARTGEGVSEVFETAIDVALEWKTSNSQSSQSSSPKVGQVFSRLYHSLKSKKRRGSSSSSASEPVPIPGPRTRVRHSSGLSPPLRHFAVPPNSPAASPKTLFRSSTKQSTSESITSSSYMQDLSSSPTQMTFDDRNIAVSKSYNFSALYDSISHSSSESNYLASTMDWSRFIEKADEFSIGGGRFGDVYRGRWVNIPRDSPTPPTVAIKVIRQTATYQQDSGKKVLRRLTREIVIWQRLSHENIVPFVGLSTRFGMVPSLISVWMENGTVSAYLEEHPDIDRPMINLGIARGLEYLHRQKPEIVHGDLKAVNILVNSAGVPCLTDFGLSKLVDGGTLWVTTATNVPGSMRWMAPEILNGETTVSTASDVYAYAMTSVEIITGRVPFPNYTQDCTVMTAVILRKERPARPPGTSEQVWRLWCACWDEEFSVRLSMTKVVDVLTRAFESGRAVAYSDQGTALN